MPQQDPVDPTPPLQAGHVFRGGQFSSFYRPTHRVKEPVDLSRMQSMRLSVTVEPRAGCRPRDREVARDVVGL